jgi:toxin YoeB
MKYSLALDIVAEQHLERHVTVGNKLLSRKILKLFEELEEHPETGTGKPHRLRHESGDVWSRKIDDRHRMLYVIDHAMLTVYVISLWGHYSDK